MPQDSIKKIDFATVLGCDPSYVTWLIAVGRIAVNAEKRIDIAEVRRYIAAIRDEAQEKAAEFNVNLGRVLTLRDAKEATKKIKKN